MDPVPGEDVRPVGSRGSCGAEEGGPCGAEEGGPCGAEEGDPCGGEEGVFVVQKIHVSYLNNILKLK